MACPLSIAGQSKVGQEHPDFRVLCSFQACACGVHTGPSGSSWECFAGIEMTYMNYSPTYHNKKNCQDSDVLSLNILHRTQVSKHITLIYLLTKCFLSTYYVLGCSRHNHSQQDNLCSRVVTFQSIRWYKMSAERINYQKKLCKGAGREVSRDYQLKK